MLKVVKAQVVCSLWLVFMLVVGVNSMAAQNKDKLFAGGRHMVLLTANVSESESSILGAYYLGIFNHYKEAKEFKTQINLPKEVIHFEAEQGLKNEDIYLGKGGALEIKKIFPPGMTLVGIGFKIKPNIFLQDEINFFIKDSITELTVASPISSKLSLSSQQLQPGLTEMLANGEYQGLLGKDIKNGSQITVLLSGFPQKKSLAWLVVVTAAIILLGAAYILAKKSQRQLKEIGV